MKKEFLLMLLIGLIGLTGNLTAMAQVPEPTGQWKFDNPSDLLAASKGSLTLSPAVLGDHSISDAAIGEAGIVAADGVAAEDGAIFVPKAAAMKLQRAEGASATMSYTFMLDMKVPDAYVYDAIFQTNGANTNDAELFISKSQIGLGGYLGGYYGRIWNDTWYRIVFTMSDGYAKLYVNGKKIINYETSDGRFELDPWGFYLFCDEDGEASDTYVSEVAFWETPLTDEEVAAMEVPAPDPWIKSLSEIKEGDQFYIISDRGKFNGPTTGKPKAMACQQENFPTKWGEIYVYWADLDKEDDGFIWTAEKVGDQWAFLNKENGRYIGNMNEGEPDVAFSDTPVGYTLTDLADGEGNFYMTNEESEHSLHVQGYLRNDRASNSLAKQEVGDDTYESADVTRNGYPGRWHFVKIGGDEPVEAGMKIETAADFEAFAQAVNEGQTDLEAYLAADITLTGNVMVGTDANKYAGTFDGKGYTITYSYSVTINYCGLFAYVNGATIRNLRVEGDAVSTAIHFGALIGRAEGTVLVENVVTNVDVTGNRSGVTGDAGMLGANYANITFNNCAVLGPLGNPGSSMYSPFSGWSNGSSSVTLNNCYAACYFKEGTGIDTNSATLTHGGTTANYFNNCYYLNYIDKVQGTQITAEQIASGELCFKLNGDQSTIGWYQTLGEDAFPVPFASHAQVYANGAVRCDGAELPDAPLTYSNTEGETTKPDHQFGEDGICTVCGQNADGYYVINSAQKLSWFATKISDGTTNINALLAVDIDLSTSDYPGLMIGTETSEYAGTFDGGGHTITYHYGIVPDKWRGLFAFVNGATIRNLYVKGSVTPTNIHYGALIGRAYGNVLVENVITDVDITGQRNNVTGDAGMLGANYANITFNNCATLGEMGYPGSSMYSPFSGWSNGTSSTTLNNCYSLCKLTEGTGTGNCFTLTHQSGTNTINNCYYLYEIGKVIAGDQTQVTEEEVANGSLCAKLGEGWYQNIGEDAYPVFDPTHGRVKEITEVGYATMYIPDAVAVPAGVEAFTGVIEGEWLKLNPVTSAVPASEPVVLKAAPGFYSFIPVESAPAIEGTNDLLGTAEPLETTGVEYVLAKPEGEEVGFYITQGTIPAGKAYLVSSSGVKGFVFSEDGATGIVNLEQNLDKNEPIYNLAGQRLQQMQKGINIVNGKKVLVK